MSCCSESKIFCYEKKTGVIVVTVKDFVMKKTGVVVVIDKDFVMKR